MSGADANRVAPIVESARSENAAADRAVADRAVAESVQRVICTTLDVEARVVRAEARLVEDLGADSIAIVELMMAFEDAFGVIIPDEATEKLRTVADATTYLQLHATRSNVAHQASARPAKGL
jgi:acyl carrier protein